MVELGAAVIGDKPKKGRSAGFGRGDMPIPRRPDEQLTSRFSPAVTPKSSLNQQGPYVVQGQRASDLEDRVYRTLRVLGWTDRNVQFQSAILGGRRPGGQIMDFVCYGPGQVYVIQVNGDYWHAVGQKADETKRNEAIIQHEMPSARVVSLFSASLLTDEIALSTLSRLVGRGL